MGEEKEILLNKINLLINKRKTNLFNELQSIHEVSEWNNYESNKNIKHKTNLHNNPIQK